MIKKALLLDDDEMILTFFTTLLAKKFGIRSATAINGIEGLEVLEKEHVDIIFMDIMMPKLDGISFLEKIRSDSRFESIPVIVISAVNQKDVIAKLAKLGIGDYILKPLEFTRIIDKLNDLFGKYDS